MNKLEELNLNENKIKDISPIYELENLKVLHISLKEFNEYYQLTELSHLEKLHLSYATKEQIKILKSEMPHTEIVSE